MKDSVIEMLSNLFKAMNIFAPNPNRKAILEEKAERMDIKNELRKSQVELKKLRIQKKINRVKNKL